jgi:hypothetical protein
LVRWTKARPFFTNPSSVFHQCWRAFCCPATTYGWFTEGFDPADLKDAKALLDQLNP